MVVLKAVGPVWLYMCCLQRNVTEDYGAVRKAVSLVAKWSNTVQSNVV